LNGARTQGESDEAFPDQISFPGRIAGGVARADPAVHRRCRSRRDLERPDRLSLHEGGQRDERIHLAASSDDEASKALQSRDFFKAYTEETKRVSGGTVEVLPLAIIAETSARA
jgi:hypothetical protein